MSTFITPCLAGATMIFLGIIIYWHVRPNTSRVAEELDIESWQVVDGRRHRAFVDMVHWRGAFYVAYRSAASHVSLRSKLVVMRSPDAREWEMVGEFRLKREDIRDPKLAVIHDRLFLYALRNRAIYVNPYATIFTSTDDGENWENWQEIEPGGVMFWRPATWDGATWYVVAARNNHRETVLLRSTDGRTWDEVSVVCTDCIQGEVGIIFPTADELVATVRIAGRNVAAVIGGSTDTTLVGVSPAPHTTWEFVESNVTRLDGPALFLHQGEVYAAGRFEPANWLSNWGNFLRKKRTALFRVEPGKGLAYLSDLPSGGDTSYPGVVVYGNDLYVCYYTSDVRRDYPWIVGQLRGTHIRMAKIKLSSLPAGN